jgi:hypothetical protein
MLIIFVVWKLNIIVLAILGIEISERYNQQIKLFVLTRESEKANNFPESISRTIPKTFPNRIVF